MICFCNISPPLPPNIFQFKLVFFIVFGNHIHFSSDKSDIVMFSLLILFSYCLISIDAHGYLYEPVARSSAWLVDSSFRQCCTWSQHMEMFCGGLGHQWRVNGLSSSFFFS